MESKPMFSVIIAAYNRAELLERALKSLSGQSEKDWEGIIADDESTDDTYARILPFLKADSRIKYFRKKHSGEALTKNYGITMSSGKYITFLDSDDEYHRDHLASRKKILIQNPGISFLHGGVEILGNQYVPDRNDPSRPIHLKDCIIGGTFVIRRETLISLEGFRNIELGPDSDLFERALGEKVPMMKTDLPTYIYHHENPDSITNILFGKIK
jgi:glycosyltransferase involved in cell wall biosynthesis